MGAVYEIVDSTDWDQYFPLGIFPTLEAALATLAGLTPDDIPGDHYDYEDFCRIEVRERPEGWSSAGKTVRVFEWVSSYNEALDEYEWKAREPAKRRFA